MAKVCTTSQLPLHHLTIHVYTTRLQVYTYLLLSIVNLQYTHGLLNNKLFIQVQPSLTHSNIAIHVNARLYLSRLQPMRRDCSDFILLAYQSYQKYRKLIIRHYMTNESIQPYFALFVLPVCCKNHSPIQLVCVYDELFPICTFQHTSIQILLQQLL